MNDKGINDKGINAPSRKGIFIPDITVEMFRNASLEGVEELMTSGEMEDISLPSAQPERKKGKWIPQDHNKTNGIASTLVYYYPKCSVCGHCDDYTNFCSNCGADMRGEKE